MSGNLQEYQVAGIEPGGGAWGCSCYKILVLNKDDEELVFVATQHEKCQT